MIPIYYYFGTRKEQVKHCRLRLAISDLNYVHADIHQKYQSISYYIVPFIIVLEIKPKTGFRARCHTHILIRIRNRAAFQRFASTDAKHYVFCVSDTKNA